MLEIEEAPHRIGRRPAFDEVQYLVNEHLATMKDPVHPLINVSVMRLSILRSAFWDGCIRDLAFHSRRWSSKNGGIS